jgi:hypothetical protein
MPGAELQRANARNGHGSPAALYVTLALKLHQVCPLLCGLAVGLSAGNAVPRLTHGLGEDHIVTTINQ